MNGLNQTILRKICPSLSQNVFTTYRDTDTAHQWWWWKFKSTCTQTICPTDQSLRLQNTCLKFWKMRSLMLYITVQNRLKGTCWKILLFYRKKPIFMSHTTIAIIHAEYQKFFISFIATLIKFFYLPLPGKTSNSCLLLYK